MSQGVLSPLRREPRLLATGLGWPEGPSVAPDGSVYFVETYRSQISVYEAKRGVRRFAYTAGGPNSCVVCHDGSLLVCQNGGTTGPWRAEKRVPPSIQRVSSSGRIETLVTEIDGLRLNGPNDLVWGPDGSLFFTDPGEYRPGTPEPSRVFRIGRDGHGALLAELSPATFPNGIAVAQDQSLYWSESYTGLIKSMNRIGEIATVCLLPGHSPVPDGMKIGAAGDFYVTTVNGGGIDVVSHRGVAVAHHACGAVPTNCSFDGAGGLFVTDAGRLADNATATTEGALWELFVDDVSAGTWYGNGSALTA